MAEAEPTINITPLRPTDPTNAERSGATVQRSKGTHAEAWWSNCGRVNGPGEAAKNPGA